MVEEDGVHIFLVTVPVCFDGGEFIGLLLVTVFFCIEDALYEKMVRAESAIQLLGRDKVSYVRLRDYEVQIAVTLSVYVVHYEVVLVY